MMYLILGKINCFLNEAGAIFQVYKIENASLWLSVNLLSCRLCGPPVTYRFKMAHISTTLILPCYFIIRSVWLP